MHAHFLMHQTGSLCNHGRDEQNFTSVLYMWPLELQSIHQLEPAQISTEVTHVVNNHLRSQGGKLSSETHKHTHVQTCIPADSRRKQTAFPFPLPVPVCSRTEPHSTPPTTSAVYNKVLFLIFLASWQKKESGVKEMLSYQTSPSLSFLAAPLPEQNSNWIQRGRGWTRTQEIHTQAYKCKNKYTETASCSRTHTHSSLETLLPLLLKIVLIFGQWWALCGSWIQDWAQLQLQMAGEATDWKYPEGKALYELLRDSDCNIIVGFCL